MAEVKIISVINQLRIRPVREATLGIEDIGKELAKVSRMDTGDAQYFVHKLSDIIINRVNQGYHVNLGKLCIIGTSCDLDGNVKITLRLSFSLRDALKSYTGRFKNKENKGLNDEGFARKWLEDHLEDAVRMRDDSLRTRDDYGL